MRYYLSCMLLCICTLVPKAYAQEKNDILSKAIGKHGNAFLKNKHITSASIGIIKDGEIYTQHFGELEKGKGNMPNDASLYEVGSVTKTIAGFLVAKAVIDGKITLDDDIRSYLKSDYPNMAYHGKPITIKHLLTHTGGLPASLPIALNAVFDKLDEDVPDNYHAIEKGYSKEQFFEDLKKISLTVEPGTQYAYSNAGTELIGHILERVYGKSIDALLKESLLDKHQINASIALDETQRKKLVRGYWMGNTHFSPMQINKLWATASGANMSMTDMIRYMQLQLNTDNQIVAESHKMLYDSGGSIKVAYFWRVRKDKYGTSFNHHGGTVGTQNWLFIFPDHQLGISIITNQSSGKTPKLLGNTIKKILKDILKV